MKSKIFPWIELVLQFLNISLITVGLIMTVVSGGNFWWLILSYNAVVFFYLIRLKNLVTGFMQVYLTVETAHGEAFDNLIAITTMTAEAIKRSEYEANQVIRKLHPN